MNDLERAVADFAYGAIQDYATTTERSIQAQQFRVGISELGHCQEFLRRTIVQEPLTDKSDFMAAFVGTAVGDYVERALIAKWPAAIRQQSIKVKLAGDQGSYEIGGHPDLIVVPDNPAVLDVKTTDGLGKIERTGPSQQQVFQRNLYALGCWQEGRFGDPEQVDPETIKVGNIWVDRSAREHRCFVNIEQFSWDVIKAATAWLDDVIYAVKYDEEAQREPSRTFCEHWCPRFSACRGTDVDSSGLIDDPDLLAAVDLHLQAIQLAKEADNMKLEARNALLGVSGSTGTHSVKWVHVNGSAVNYYRDDYERLSVSRMR